MTKDNGGPAFPLADPSMINPASVAEYEQFAHGISIRDYFAAKFLCGRAAAPWLVDPEMDAETAYRVADAMLAERAK